MGLLHYSFLLLITAYIAVKVLYIDQGYNEHDTPIGSVRVTLKMPSKGVDLREEDYCPNSGDNYSWDYPTEKGFPCQIWDEHSVRYPLDELNAAFVSTRVTQTEQTYACGGDYPNGSSPDVCVTPYVDGESKTFFLGGVRSYTFGLQHNFYAPMFTSTDPKRKGLYRGSSNDVIGDLVKHDGTYMKRFPYSKAGEPDIVTVGTLMDAAGIDIRAVSPDPNNSLLYSGVLTLVLISYDNSEQATHYTYRAQYIPNSDFKVYNIRWNSDQGDSAPTRTLFKHAGPKFVFIVTGDMVRFDFQTLLVQLVSALGLLSFAVLIVDMVMLYVLPSKNIYRENKFVVTKRFTSESDEETDDLEAPLNRNQFA